MNNTSWYRMSKDIETKDGSSIRVWQTVFETSDYDLSEKSVKWCRKQMDELQPEMCLSYADGSDFQGTYDYFLVDDDGVYITPQTEGSE